MAAVDWIPRTLLEQAARSRRDAAFLWETLVMGRQPSPLVARPHRPHSAVVQLRGLKTRALLVDEVVQETPDAVSIYLTESDGSEIAHEAGQFLTVELVVDGVPLRRAYSLANAALTGHRRHITVKRMPGGRVSTRLVVSPPKTLDVLGPSGAFTAPADADRIVAIAGGSGITPIMSIVETALRTSSASVVLLYGNRSQTDTIFFDRLERLFLEFPNRLRIEHVWDTLLDEATQRARLRPHLSDDAHYFLCGPTPMIDASQRALADVPSARVHVERFTQPEKRAQSESRTSDASPGPHPVQIRLGRDHRTVEVSGTLLEAGLQAGLPMPFSCAMGGCAACKVKLVDGSVAMQEPSCLTDEEHAEGWVLACCSTPTSPCTIEVPS